MSLAVIAANGADYARADPRDRQPSKAEDSFALAPPASAVPLPKVAPRSTIIDPLFSPSTPRAPAQYFTVNEVMGNRGAVATFFSIRSDEPFGLAAFVLPEGLLWSKWRKIEVDIGSEEPILTRCLEDQRQCTPAAARFGAIVLDARKARGLAKLELVNQRVNAEIRYKSDSEQWGVADLWSTPLATFATGFGDCEDYAIAKYVALHESGMSVDELRVVLGHDNGRRTDHAVVAARNDRRWLILDNLTQRLLPAAEASHFTPLFAFDGRGVIMLAAPYAPRPVSGLESLDVMPASGSDEFDIDYDLTVNNRSPGTC